MKNIYTEIGFGNDTFLSTEVEDGESEYRIPRFKLPEKITQIYFRFWVGKKVLVISTFDGFKIQTKNRNKLKILFGIGGTGLKDTK